MSIINGSFCPISSEAKLFFNITSNLLGTAIHQFNIPVSSFKGVVNTEQKVSLRLQKSEKLAISDVELKTNGTLTVLFNKPIIKPNIWIDQVGAETLTNSTAPRRSLEEEDPLFFYKIDEFMKAQIFDADGEEGVNKTLCDIKLTDIRSQALISQLKFC